MSKPIVVVTEPLASEPLEWIANRSTLIQSDPSETAEFHAALRSAQALIVRTYTIVDDQLLEQAPALKVVGRAGVGLDNIDLDACKARGIIVVHTPNSNTSAVVEYVTQMMLGVIRPLAKIDPTAHGADWHELRKSAVSMRCSADSTLGIVGMGQIGSAMARIGSALSMRVLYNDIREIPQNERFGAAPVSLDELCSQADVVSIHVDGTLSNKHLIASAFFDQLKDHAIVINTARGFVIDDEAAARFAQTHPNATLILDVFTPEPIASTSPFLKLPNVICTPHIGAGTQCAKTEMSWVVRDVMRVLDGEAPHHPAL